MLLLARRGRHFSGGPDLRRRALLHRPRPQLSLEPAPVPDAVRARVQATWAFRARAEVEAQARFARMATELPGAGATPLVVQGALDAAADEARHHILCLRLAEKWGDTTARHHVAPRERIGRSDMEPRDRLLWELVAVCCLSETMNTALMTRCMEVTTEPEIRSTLHELLRDEVRHARLGWAHLAAERASGRGAFLPGVLPVMLEASVEPGFLEREEESPPFLADLHRHGELPHGELVALYRDTLDQVFFRGLESFGLDTSPGRAWLSARLRDRQP
jgi:hypothetical protein